LAAIQYLAGLAVLLDQPQKRICDCCATAMSTSSSRLERRRREIYSRQMTRAYPGIRLNTVEARGYSPPANCREQAGFSYSGEIVRKVEERSWELN